MRLIAFITEGAVIVRILDHLGEPSRAQRMAPIRGPPHGAMQQRDDLDTRRSLTSIRRPRSCPTTRTRCESTSTSRRWQRLPAKWRKHL